MPGKADGVSPKTIAVPNFSRCAALPGVCGSRSRQRCREGARHRTTDMPAPHPAPHPAPAAPAVGASRNPRIILTVTAVLLVGGIAAVAGWLTAQDRLGAEVARLAKPGDIRMIASEDCAVCHVARRWFEEHRIAFSSCTIELDAQCAADFRALRAQGTPVMLVRGQVVMGFEPHRMRQLLGG